MLDPDSFMKGPFISMVSGNGQVKKINNSLN